MLWNAYGIAREALEQLLDRELPSEDRRKIAEAVRACAGVRDIHDLRTRFSGDRTFVEYHLEVDPGLTVDVGHAIGDATEVAVQKLLPGTVEATAHVEPFGIADARLDDAVAESHELPIEPAMSEKRARRTTTIMTTATIMADTITPTRRRISARPSPSASRSTSGSSRSRRPTA